MNIELKKNHYQLLACLADGKIHSGSDLGKRLQITRAAVWKIIHQLNEANFEIESLSTLGYRLKQPIDLLDQDKILPKLISSLRTALHRLDILNQVDSTNNYLLNLNLSDPLNIACFAEQQSKGRGRHGRTWISPYGQNIYFSLLWHFFKDPSELTGLSLIMAVAVIRTLYQYGITEHLGIKWPNDVFYKNNKLAGILIDMIAQPHTQCSVVIGIGINTFLSQQQGQSITQPWISLQEILQTKIDRNRLAGLLLNEVGKALLQFAEDGLTEFLPEWRRYDILLGKNIIVKNARRELHGIMHGISPLGELVLYEPQEQKHHRFLSGEISVLTSPTNLRLQKMIDHR